MQNTTLYHGGTLFFRINDASRYYVSHCGQILSTAKGKTEILTGCIQSKGYHQVVIYRDDKSKWPALVHQIVALQFLPKPAAGKDQVNHIDGNQLNNHVGNLEWVTNKENYRHARELRFKRTFQIRFSFWK